MSVAESNSYIPISPSKTPKHICSFALNQPSLTTKFIVDGTAPAASAGILSDP